MGWEESMRNLKDLAEYNQLFRHDIPRVPVSLIARQYYCEQKIEMEFVHGEIKTAAKTEGEMLHKELIQTKETTLSDIIKKIKKRKTYCATFPIIARISELVIIGKPDLIVFVKGTPAYLIELKTTKSDTSRLWPAQLVQVKVYGLILDEMGFDCSKLKLVIVKIRRRRDLAEQCRTKLLDELITQLLEGKWKIRSNETETTTDIIEYNKQDVIPHIKWAEAYWLSQRGPRPTEKIWKCRSCEFNDECSSSLVRAHGQKSIESFSVLTTEQSV